MNMIKNFADIIVEAQKYKSIKVIVSVAQDESVLRGIALAKKLGLLEAIFVGDKEKIIDIIESNGFDLKDEEIIPETDKMQACYKAIELARSGKAEAIMKGGIDNQMFLGTALDKRGGLRTGKFVCSICLLEDLKNNRILYLSDPAMNISPNLQEKAEIIKSAVEFVKIMGISRPKVAVISAIELVSPNMPSTIDAACLSKMADRGQIKDAIVDGPFALDTLFSSQAAKKKGVKSPLAGEVDIILAPNIETANAIYKMWTHFIEYNAIGISWGAKVQLIHLPRESSPEDKLVGIATTVLMLRKGNN